ncbi:MAG: transglycosylase SLT domain-containing protein, partial [Myxococcales bacterium]|nr:transglycosylase SLT domain-containing protein [Myxococcales bacterium]
MTRRVLPKLVLLVTGVALAAALGACGTTYRYGPGSGPSGSEVEIVYLDGRAPARATVGKPGRAGVTDGWADADRARCAVVERHLRATAADTGLDVGLLAGIAYVESRFQTSAVSRRGATGLMQVMPKVARRLGCGDLLDPADNIACGAVVLKRFLARFDDDLVYGVSAYNAGYRVPREAQESG